MNHAAEILTALSAALIHTACTATVFALAASACRRNVWLRRPFIALISGCGLAGAALAILTKYL